MSRQLYPPKPASKPNKTQFGTAIIAFFMIGSLLSAGSVFGAEQTRQNAHIKIKDPLQLTPEKAEEKYRSIIESLQKMYAISKDPSAKNYLRWERSNSAPYLSGTHGNRYVNNY